MQIKLSRTNLALNFSFNKEIITLTLRLLNAKGETETKAFESKKSKITKQLKTKILAHLVSFITKPKFKQHSHELVMLHNSLSYLLENVKYETA